MMIVPGVRAEVNEVEVRTNSSVGGEAELLTERETSSAGGMTMTPGWSA